MNAQQIMDKLFSLSFDSDFSNTCDTLKAGDPKTEVTKIAVTMHATVEVVKKAADWGAQLLIVHEPVYYNHLDNHSNERIECEKRKLIQDLNLTIFRYHDHPHSCTPDIIGAGQFKNLGLEGSIEPTNRFGLTKFHLAKPISALELAKILETRSGLKHVKLCGNLNHKFSTILGLFGTPGHLKEEFSKDGEQFILTGEISEWSLGEFVRDAAALGHKKALIVMGHEGSEREGMVYTTEILSQMFPKLEVKYIECGEVYTYTDNL